MDVQPPRQLLKPINVPRKIMTGPGPSNYSSRVEKAAGMQPMSISFLHPEMHQIIDEVREGIKYLFQTKNQVTLCVSGCAHVAVESICHNILEPDDVILVACNGLWGHRFAEMADRQGIQSIRKLEKTQGLAFNLSEIELALKEVQPVLFFITHGESTGGVLQPLEGLGRLCHRYGCLLVVDSVAAAGAVPLYMDRWEIDVIYTGSQKVLGTPAGMVPISISPRAWNRVKNRKRKIATFVHDLTLLFDIWGCDEHSYSKRNFRYNYHHTYNFSNIYCLRESLSALVEEGLENRWKRHQECTAELHRGVQDLGLEFLVKDPSLRLPVVTTIQVPAGIDWKVVSQYAMDTYRMEIAGGLGANAGDIWRIGLMGFNAQPNIAKLAVKALGEGLEKAKKSGKSNL